MPQAITSLSGSTAYQEASRRARYGHRDWIVWRDSEGVTQARRISREALIECLRANGTQGKWFYIGRSDGVGMRAGWRIGINLLYQIKHGLLY